MPGEGKLIVIPKVVVLPKGLLSEGITINVAEMRLFYTVKTEGHETLLYTCPIGIGRSGFSTRPGLYMVRSKKKDPTWHVPASIRSQEPDLPARVPPGPDNPLGRYVLRFSRHAYAIHGTNKPFGIGRRVSHGCIRCYPEDIEELYSMVPVGTLINIVYEPVKAVYQDGRCWLQVFSDHEDRVPNILERTLLEVGRCLNKAGRIDDMDIDLSTLKEAVGTHTGLPVPVTAIRQ